MLDWEVNEEIYELLTKKDSKWISNRIHQK
jgi:hypothetical protein